MANADKSLTGAAGEHLVLSRLLTRGLLAAQALEGSGRSTHHAEKGSAVGSRRQTLIVAVDSMSNTLAVLERDSALEDAQFIRTLIDARTLGQVRAGSQRALHSVRELYETTQADNDADGDFDALPDDTPFSVIDWFDVDYWYLVMPLARLITESTVPPEVLLAFGQEDRDIGLDYKRATWFRPEDSDAIVAELRALGYEVDDGPKARAILQDFDYTGAH